MKPYYSFDQIENTSNNPEHFAFNLGASVSAGRSVPLVMQKEFKSWYDINRSRPIWGQMKTYQHYYAEDVFI